MRAPLAVAAALILVLATVASAQAATFQTGVVSYTASGSWTTTTTVRDQCDVSTGPGTVESREFSYPVVEHGTFASGRGTAHYQGDVGRTPFFLGNGDRAARLRVKVTRTAKKPFACVGEPKPDCGTKTLKGVARSQFEGPFRAGRPLDLHLSFARSKTAFELTDPFKTCGEGNTSLFLNSASGTSARPDYQDRALRYPAVRAFWARKRSTLKGTARARGVTFTLKLTTARTTLSSRRDLHR